ncbi:TetR/AcrR family transcriptional regulator [Spirillospora sp. CA-255316]
MDAFAQTGFYGATMKDVARRAGISYTGLMHHFPSKEDLLIAVLDFRSEQNARVMEAADARDPVGQPLKALKGVLAVSARNAESPGLRELHCVISGEAWAAPGYRPAGGLSGGRRSAISRTALMMAGHGRAGADQGPSGWFEPRATMSRLSREVGWLSSSMPVTCLPLGGSRPGSTWFATPSGRWMCGWIGTSLWRDGSRPRNSARSASEGSRPRRPTAFTARPD